MDVNQFQFGDTYLVEIMILFTTNNNSIIYITIGWVDVIYDMDW